MQVSRALRKTALLLILLGTSKQVCGRPITTSICFTLTEEIQCPVGQVVQVRSARYGRMELGTCITFDMGMGCFKDILQTADKWCSGKQSCVVENDRATMDKQLGLPCPAELTSYIEISHDCIGVTRPNRHCRAGSSEKLLTWPGTLSSSVTDETNCGSPQSPWVIEGAPGQRIDLSLANFGWTTSSNNQSTGGACQLFGHIIERSLNINRSLCGGSARESHLYTSMSNAVEIHVVPLRQRLVKANFLLKYTVLGCPDIQPPPHAWYKRQGDTIQVGCETNHNSWDLVCEGNEWKGVLGNCTQEAVQPNDEQTQATSFLSPVITVALISGLGAIVLILLVAIIVGFICCSRSSRRAKATRSQAGVVSGGPLGDSRTLYRAVDHGDDLIHFSNTVPRHQVPQTQGAPYYTYRSGPPGQHGVPNPGMPVNQPPRYSPPTGPAPIPPQLPPGWDSPFTGTELKDTSTGESEYASLNKLTLPSQQATLRVRPEGGEGQQVGIEGGKEGEGEGDGNDSDSSNYYWQGTRKYHVLEKEG